MDFSMLLPLLGAGAGYGLGGTSGAALGAGLGGTLAGGMAQSGASDTQREAARRSIELSKNQSLLNSQTMAPYTAAGYAGLQDLFGITMGGGGGYAAPGGDGYSVPVLTSKKNKWDAPTKIGEAEFTRTGTGIDPTGGAGEFMDQLKSYGTNFQFDPSNPAYTQKLKLAQEANDKALASRGMYNSRAGLNLQDETARNVQSEEFEKQYQRGYSNLMDMFNMSRTLGATNYSKALDAVKIGQGSASTAGALGNQAVGNLNSAYGGMANVAGQNADNQANMYSALGAMPMNYMVLQNLLGGGGNQGTPYTGSGIDWTSQDQWSLG